MYPAENYLWPKTSPYNFFEIYRPILNFANHVSTRSESQYMPYNQRKSTVILS